MDYFDDEQNVRDYIRMAEGYDGRALVDKLGAYLGEGATVLELGMGPGIDLDMLRDGPYPWHLKQRVSGRLGHLSNREAAEMLRQTASADCRAVVLAHLSEKNNTPALARRAAASVLAANGRGRVEMRVASPTRPTPPVCL